MNPYLSTFLHIAELLACAIIAYGLMRFFGLNTSVVEPIIIAVLSGLAKLVRAIPDSGVPDYVNSSLDKQS